MNKTTLILLLVLCVALIAQSEWRVDFTVIGVDSVLYLRGFGIADGASDGYDALFDLPLFTSDDDTSVFFPVEGSWITSALSQDIRSNRLASHDWTMVFQHMDLSTVEWFRDSLPPDGDFEVCVFHPDSSSETCFDMRITPMVIVPEERWVSFSWDIEPGEDTIPPYITGWSPADGAVDVPRETNISCEVHDSGTGVDSDEISIEVDGINVTMLASIDSIPGGGFSVNYDPLLDFSYDVVIEVVVSAYDLETPSNLISDTVSWRTVPDSIFYAVSGTVGTGDPWYPVENAIVQVGDNYDTTDVEGYFNFSSVHQGSNTIRANADGYDESTSWIWLVSDTSVNMTLRMASPPEVLVIDYDSGSEPFEDDSVGEETIIADLLDNLGYEYEITCQNPAIDTLPLDDYRFVILITPVDETGHWIIPDSELDYLIDWLEDDGRLLWIAPNGGVDYGEGSIFGEAFFNMFGVNFESNGRDYTAGGNVSYLTSESDYFYLDVYVTYDSLTMADHYIDEISPVDSHSIVILESQESSPTPLVSNDRIIFHEDSTYLCVISTILFGGINDGIFPNTATNILRGCMNFLETEVGIDENLIKIPEKMELETYPNPFNAAISIVTPGDARIRIYDIGGGLIDDFASCENSKSHKAKYIWKPTSELGSGVYLIRAEYDGRSDFKRVIYLK